MNVKTLLRLQLLYCVLGILFNIINYGLIQNGKQALTPTVPIEGFLAMSIYGTFLLSGYYKKIGLYRVLMFLSIILLGYGGVVHNILLLNKSPELYQSIFAGCVGLGINVFGLILNTRAVLGKFEK